MRKKLFYFGYSCSIAQQLPITEGRSSGSFKHNKETGEYTKEMGLWYTAHNSTYNIAARKLWITIHEQYDKHYEFSLEK